VFSTAFICRYTHEDGWYPVTIVCFFGTEEGGILFS